MFSGLTSLWQVILSVLLIFFREKFGKQKDANLTETTKPSDKMLKYSNQETTKQKNEVYDSSKKCNLFSNAHSTNKRPDHSQKNQLNDIQHKKTATVHIDEIQKKHI
ncbi:hypothetical protein M153_5490005655 [Pseudoloma neurophilia]|uniref:Uncharacterized protein n=1 Tax=Pseudoloma neurophilia TaxID=146866 RepID=A0A0R0LWR8_9MICR|nr:hypothetical protein M153_5490005655 [Pseudoloma neurophilia]